ncbi:hypothetical protein QYF36_000488 [Acer negundo]|nr:hypothetical protein QYF36_000488 [Acer negundo]
MVDVESGYGSAPVSFKHFLSTELFKTGGRNPIPRNVVSFDKEISIRKTRMTSTYITLIDLYRKARDLKDVIKELRPYLNPVEGATSLSEAGGWVRDSICFLAKTGFRFRWSAAPFDADDG